MTGAGARGPAGGSGHRSPVALAAVIALVGAATSGAAPRGVAVCSVSGTVGLLSVRSAETQTRGVLSLALSGRYHESLDLSDEIGSDDVGRYTGVHLNASYGVASWLELGADVPFRRAVWTVGDASVTGEALDVPSVSAKVALPLDSSVFSVAVEGRASIPLERELVVGGSSGTDGSHYVTGGSIADWEAALLATLDFTDFLPLRLHANVGWASHLEEERGRRFYPDYYPAAPEGADRSANDALLMRAAVEFPGRSVDLFTEFRGDMIRDRGLVAVKENALSLTPGVRARFGGWSATLGLTVGLSGNDRATPEFDPHEAYPDWELAVSIGYGWPVLAADTDGDGIPDFQDECATLAEDRDGFEDADGCPDPDNDRDGIPDDSDGAPELPEDLDGFEDGDGVPDLDNDGDGIVDERDMCPDEREDLDGFEDQDGCPDK
jgi:hypothetical protein